MTMSSKRSTPNERARRKASRKKGGHRRRKIPLVPIILTSAVIAVVAVVAVAILQSGGQGGNSGDAIAAEASDDPSLPGQYVDLPNIYDGPYGSGDGGTGGHVSRDIDYVADGNTNPPAGGPHWSGRCAEDPSDAPAFCGPAPWGIYREPWEPATLVHNMEHAGVIIWYNTSAQQTIDELEDIAEARLEDGTNLVLAPYPDMEPETIALTAWSRIEKFPVTEYSKSRMEKFIDTHERRFNPEGF